MPKYSAVARVENPAVEDAVDVVLGQAGVGQRVVGRLGMVLQRRLAGDVPHDIGLGHANYGDVSWGGASGSHC